MIKSINGVQYRDLLDHGLRELRLHRDEINELNVFPVPDGDTGSNMVLTLENGINAIKGKEDELCVLARSFSNSVIFGARGNSGVILSQFLKGFSERFFDCAEADVGPFVNALNNGVVSAYKAVSEPVEGTMLTVARESAEALTRAYSEGMAETVDDAVTLFLAAARVSLENTPELLPVLKSAGVIDSGGAGLVYIFEGMRKYLNNETISDSSDTDAGHTASEQVRYIDYSKYDRTSRFPLGYCTEILLQLSNEKPEPAPDEFKSALNEIGTSVVTSFEADKVKVHIHTVEPERLISYCHSFGEFLSVKIENMSVQHSESSRYTLSDSRALDDTAVVVVAHDEKMRELFFSMGADVVIDGTDGYNPSAKDFHDAFTALGCKNIFVFPNSKSSLFAAEQAAKLYEGARVIVLNSRSAAECYSALAIFDFDSDDVDSLAENLTESIANIYTVTITRAVKAQNYDDAVIEKGDHIALAGSRLIAVGKQLMSVAEETVRTVIGERDCGVVTAFLGAGFDEDTAAELLDIIKRCSVYTDADHICTDSTSYELLLSFE